MRVLVIGGSGFIGSHVIDALLKDGNDVRIFDAVLSTYHSTSEVEFFHGDILNLESVRMALDKVDVILHLCAVADVYEVAKDPRRAEEVNVQGTTNVLEAVRLGEQVKRVIYASTVWVYSDVMSSFVDEDTLIPPPTHFYTVTKYVGELYCQSYAKMYGIDYTILRYGIPYGPRARMNAVIPVFVKKALEGQPIVIDGDGSQFRKFLYVEDLAEAHTAVLDHFETTRNQIYNIEGSEKITIKQITESIKSLVEIPVDIQFGEKREGDFSGKEISSMKAFDHFSWEPSTTFEEGLKKYIKWYIEKVK